VGVGSRLGRGRRLSGGGAALEGDGGDDDAAGRLWLGWLGGVDDGDVLGTTTLGVLNSGAGLGAGRALLAGRTVGHVILELEVAIELGAQGDGAQRKLVRATRSAAKGRRTTLLLRASTTNDVLVGARSESLAETILLAREALEVETTIAEEATQAEVTEVEASSLLVRALVVRVARA
jgi:hypothetical protein